MPQEKVQHIDRMKNVLELSQETAGAYETTVLGRDFWVLPGVFSPAYYAETAFYTRHVLGCVNSGQKYLDLGCGAGVTAVFAALSGALVTALDVNPFAVENTRMNVHLHGVEDLVRVGVSHIYSALSERDLFDVVYWNVPFGFRTDGTQLTMLEEAVFDPGYEKNREFIRGAATHMNPGGMLLIGVSPTLGDVEAIAGFGAKAGMHFEVLAEMIDPDSTVEIRFQLWRGCRV